MKRKTKDASADTLRELSAVLRDTLPTLQGLAMAGNDSAYDLLERARAALAKAKP